MSGPRRAGGRVSAPAPSSERVGGTLLEALLSLLLGVVVVTLVVGLVHRTREVARGLTLRSDRLAAVRMARTLLQLDGPGALAVGTGPDSMQVRAFRGTARFCGPGEDSTAWWVEVTGVRRPDPAKDSVAVLGRGGGWSVHGLEARRPSAACGGPSGVRGEVWRLAPAPVGPILGRYFERGSYHLSDRAFRYRRGRGGRQPLTPAVLAAPPGRFERHGERLRARLRFEPPGSAPPAEWVLPVPRGTGSGDG